MSEDEPSEAEERRLRMAMMQTEIDLNRAQTDVARATLEQIRATVNRIEIEAHRMEVEARWEPWKALAAIIAASAAMVGVIEALSHLHR